MEFRHNTTKKPVMFITANKVDWLPDQIEISEPSDLPDVDYSMLGIPPGIYLGQGKQGVFGWMAAFKSVNEFYLTFFASGFPDGVMPEAIQSAMEESEDNNE